MVIYEVNSNATDPPEGGGMSNVLNLERRKLVQAQLVLLLHADQCRPAINNACSIPHCQLMKDVFRHRDTCQFGRSCEVPLCVSSVRILIHWRTCLKGHCPICGPIISFTDSLKCNGV